METTENAATQSTTLSTEAYWARVQELRAQLADLRQSAPAC